MAGFRMSFMDALKVAAQTKELPSEWMSSEATPSSSWPATLDDPRFTPPSKGKKRPRSDDSPLQSPRSPTVRPSLAALSSLSSSLSNAGSSSVSSSPSVDPGYSAGVMFSSWKVNEMHAARAKRDSSSEPGGAAPLKATKSLGRGEPHPCSPLTRTSTSAAERPSHPGLQSRLGSGSCSGSGSGSGSLSAVVAAPSSGCPPAPKRRKPFDLGWISAVASSIRGPWSVKRRQEGTPAASENPPNDKAVQHVVHQVAEQHARQQQSLPKLSEVLKWESDLVTGASAGASPAASSSKLLESDPSLVGGVPFSKLVSDSAIARCLATPWPGSVQKPQQASKLGPALSRESGAATRGTLIKTEDYVDTRSAELSMLPDASSHFGSQDPAASEADIAARWLTSSSSDASLPSSTAAAPEPSVREEDKLCINDFLNDLNPEDHATLSGFMAAGAEVKPAPPLIDTGALAAACPEVLADLCGVMQSPDASGPEMPSPNEMAAWSTAGSSGEGSMAQAGGGYASLWAEAWSDDFRIDLASLNSSNGLW